MMADFTSIASKGQKSRPFWQLLQIVAPDVQCELRFDRLRLISGRAAQLGIDLLGHTRHRAARIDADADAAAIRTRPHRGAFKLHRRTSSDSSQR